MIRKFLASWLFVLALLVPAAAFNGAVYTLAAIGVTTALSSSAQTPIVNLAGMTAATIEVAFSYGSGGTSVAVDVQTSCDGGTVWLDVAYFAFTTASATKYANLSGLTAKSVGSYAALSMDGVNDGLLCDRLRAVLTSVGTYANTTVAVRAAVR